MSVRLRIGIIGVRGMGDTRAKNITTRSDAVVTWIAGRDEEFIKEKAEQYNCKYTASWQELMQKDDVDAVIVCTPNALHHSMGMSILEAGKHLLIEYPLANSLKEIDDLIVSAKNRNLVLHTGLTARLEPQHLFFKQKLPELGDVSNGFYATDLEYIWKWAAQDEAMGDFFNLANFDFVDKSVDLFGPVEWVNASLEVKKDHDGKNARIIGCQHLGFVNKVSIFAHYGMGVTGKFYFTSYLVGEKGFLWFDDGSITFGRLGPDGKKKSTEVVDPSIWRSGPDPYLADTSNFVEEILHGEPVKFSGETARYVSEVCFASTESARKGKRVSIPAPMVEIRT